MTKPNGEDKLSALVARQKDLEDRYDVALAAHLRSETALMKLHGQMIKAYEAVDAVVAEMQEARESRLRPDQAPALKMVPKDIVESDVTVPRVPTKKAPEEDVIEGRFLGAEFNAADWMDADKTDIPPELKKQLEDALAESEAANGVRLGEPEYKRMTPGDKDVPPKPAEIKHDVVLMVATAKVEEVLKLN